MGYLPHVVYSFLGQSSKRTDLLKLVMAGPRRTQTKAGKSVMRDVLFLGWPGQASMEAAFKPRPYEEGRGDREMGNIPGRTRGALAVTWKELAVSPELKAP